MILESLPSGYGSWPKFKIGNLFFFFYGSLNTFDFFRQALVAAAIALFQVYLVPVWWPKRVSGPVDQWISPWRKCVDLTRRTVVIWAVWYVLSGLVFGGENRVEPLILQLIFLKNMGFLVECSFNILRNQFWVCSFWDKKSQLFGWTWSHNSLLSCGQILFAVLVDGCWWISTLVFLHPNNFGMTLQPWTLNQSFVCCSMQWHMFHGF